MALAYEDRRQAFAPGALHGGEDTQLVIDHDVVCGRKTPLDVGQHLLLVQVDQYTPLDRVPQARALHLARLKNHVTVGDNDRRTKTATTCKRRKRPRVETARERIV